MFIVLCQDIIEKSISSISSNSPNSPENRCAVNTLKMILLGIKLRKHIVFAPELSEEDISHLENVLTKDEVRLLMFVHSKRQDSYSLMNKLSIVAYITFEESRINDDHVIVINPRHYTTFELFEETHFIVENILDAQFYSKAVCRYYQRKNNLNTSCYSVAFYPVQGGGATISEVLKYEIELEHHFCLVIGDSDKKCINHRVEGDTAKNIRSVVDEFKKGKKYLPIDVYIMSQVREIENLIPICILEIFSNSNQKSFLKKHKNNLAFFDFKLGMEYRILYNDDVYNGWKMVFPDIIDWKLIDTYKESSHNQTEFESKLKTQQLPKIVDEWGKSILKNVLNPKKKKQKDLIRKLYEIKETDLTPFQKDEWDSIGKIIFSWCCCFNKTVF